MTRAYIVPDCLVFYLLSVYPITQADKRSQLERDLHMAKIMWTVNKAVNQKLFKTKYVMMVDNYMRKHPDKDIEQVLLNDDYTTLLP